MAPARRRLTKADWIEAGQDLLRSGGSGAVKLTAVADSLGVTTGSFYHHFSDFGAYLDELADHYGTEQFPSALAELRETDPVDRLRHLARIAVDQDMRRLDWAMRVWGESSAHARVAVRRSDTDLLTFLVQTFEDLGFTRSDARIRALVLLSAAVMPVEPPWGSQEVGLRGILDVLLTATGTPSTGPSSR